MKLRASRLSRKLIGPLAFVFVLHRSRGRSVATILAGIACVVFPARPLVGQVPRDTVLRRDLLSRRVRDQALRDTVMRSYQTGQTPDTTLIARLRFSDRANTRWLKAVIERNGWPGRSLVGDDGASAAFLLVQHSTEDQSFMETSLPLLERAVTEGEASASDYALLYDRVSLARGLAQRFGTQAQLVDGRVLFDRIDDSSHVDERRARLGLPPLATYKRMLDSLYARQAKSP